jgi:uracil-DNA glycosylase
VGGYRSVEELIEAVRKEALREQMPIDTEVYEKADKDPFQPVLFAGSLDAPVCFFGRDLGKDEVRWSQPLIGAGGKLVREGILAARQASEAGHDDSQAGLQNALKYALLTNTVPYKPPGNKAYAEPIKERFRPFLAELLTRFWKGQQIITLGTEAFRWFEPYADRKEWETSGMTDARFDTAFTCRIPKSETNHLQSELKVCRLRPLPHPSPLNRRWFGQFPSMLGCRLAEVSQEIAEGGP